MSELQWVEGMCRDTIEKPVPETVTITEEHVPHAQNWCPRQGSGEGTHEPLGHVEDGVNLVFLQMSESKRGNATQQSKQNLAVQLNRFLKETQKEKHSDELLEFEPNRWKVN